MHCERARELISPDLDGELAAEERTLLGRHLEACADCGALAGDLTRLSKALAARGRALPPKSLRPQLLATLALEQSRSQRPLAVTAAGGGSRARWRWRASLAVASCAAAALAGWLVHAADVRGRLEHDVISAHVRSLLQANPIEVAAADTHVVKPWFSGRIDFSPDVKDLSADGFALVGGRLDYVGERRVGVLVYRRQRHIINVFSWPDGARAAQAPELMTRHGYTLVSWTRAGLNYWAISDLDAGELARLAELL